jgi:branched-chain amino acid transport system substrate-binding protein
MYNVSFTGATGKVEFDAKGDRKDAEITIFRLKDGTIKPLAVVKNGVSTPFAAPAAAAPAMPPAAPVAAPASGAPKEEAKKDEKKK